MNRTTTAQWPSGRGKRSVYAVHGVFYDPVGGSIHVTMGGPDPKLVNAHLSYKPGTREFAAYERLLDAYGRGPNTIGETE